MNISVKQNKTASVTRYDHCVIKNLSSKTYKTIHPIFIAIWQFETFNAMRTRR